METYKGNYTGEEIDALLDLIPYLQNGGDDKTEEYVISNASNEWVIEHTMNKYPSVTIVELYTGEEVVADVIYESTSRIKIRFTESMKGKVILN